MPRIRVIGDGPHEQRVLPILLRRILAREVECETRDAWQHIHQKSITIGTHRLAGYAYRLYAAIRLAESKGLHGVAAVVDADKDGPHARFKQLTLARDAIRHESVLMPVAVGEAIPHGEAWLLDDPAAVREALGLPSGHDIPNVAKCPSPKDALQKLHSGGPRCGDLPRDIRTSIAERLEEQRCNHAEQTGFGPFVREVRSELAPLFTDQP